jgi:hypothetical protein
MEEGQFLLAGHARFNQPDARALKCPVGIQQLECALQALGFEGMGFAVTRPPERG